MQGRVQLQEVGVFRYIAEGRCVGREIEEIELVMVRHDGFANGYLDVRHLDGGGGDAAVEGPGGYGRR